MNDKQKILFSGDVEGRLDAFIKRITTVNRKTGPYDAVFCVGNFFGINNRELIDYRTVPIPIYILGPNNESQLALYDEENTELCPNLNYLGKRGLYTDKNGLMIAYISGVAKERGETLYEYDKDDIKELYELCLRGNPSFRGIDVLLTSQWPEGITDKITPSQSSSLLPWLIMKLKPRYHIAGLEGVYHERPPFRCPNAKDSDTTLEIATRFLGLARVGNVEKTKWLYALNLTPLTKMKISELLQKTTDETDCPYDLNELENKIFGIKRQTVEKRQYFYDMTPDEKMNANGGKERRKKRPRIEFDRDKCWFCLASPDVEKHLIVTVGETVYLALAKGGLVDEHFLLCPIEHYQNALEQSDEVSEEMEKFKKSLRKFYGRKNEVPIFFERNYKTSHMQVQAIPIPKEDCGDLKELFMDFGRSHGVVLKKLEDNLRLNQVIQPRTPYFLVELPDGDTLYTVIKGQFPLNFAREVVADVSLLNMPQRIDWKACTLGKNAEEKLIEKLRKDYQPFDFTL